MSDQTGTGERTVFCLGGIRLAGKPGVAHPQEFFLAGRARVYMFQWSVCILFQHHEAVKPFPGDSARSEMQHQRMDLHQDLRRQIEPDHVTGIETSVVKAN